MRRAAIAGCRVGQALVFAASGSLRALSSSTTECVRGPQAGQVTSETTDTAEYASPCSDRHVDGSGLGADDAGCEAGAGASTEHRGAEATRCRPSRSVGLIGELVPLLLNLLNEVWIAG